MIRLTNLADYAVVLMCHLAQDPNEVHSAVALSRLSSIPVPTVSKILGSLSRAGILRSQRGLGGGFRLARPASEVSVVAIIEALDGPIALTNCVEHSNGECGLETYCSMRPHWQHINSAVRNALAGISLSDLTAPTTADGLFGAVSGSAVGGRPKPNLA